MSDEKISVDTLKDRFKNRSIPVEGDFYNLIEMANAGQKAAGQSSEQTQLVQDTGLELDGHERLKVKTATNGALQVDTEGVSVVIDNAKGLDITNDKLSVTVGNGIKYNASGQLEVLPKEDRGLLVTTNGLEVKAGKGITVDQNGVNFNFSDAMPAGTILMWSGVGSNIPPGWALCDGNNGTPNLIGRFIMGGDLQSGGKSNIMPPDCMNNNDINNISFSYTTQAVAIDVAVTVNGTQLTQAQMPSHNHLGGVQWGKPGNNSVSEYGTTESTGGHMVAGFGGFGDYGSSSKYDLYFTSSAGNSQPHSHLATAIVNNHEHKVNFSIPYYIVVFIVKVN
jgi:hypothetical protein